MSQTLITKSSPNGPFVYIENNIGNSLAFGADDANAVYVLNTSATANVIPAAASANLIFDPTANGNVTIVPNGSGKINALNVAGGSVSNKEYVTIDTVTGELGSDTMSVSFMWNEVTGTSSAMAVENGYIANNGALVTLTLPATAILGSVIEVSGKGVGGWKVAQNAGQTVLWNATTATTVGIGGSLSSTDRYDSIKLLCITADTTWNVLTAKGNITVT